MAERYLIIDHLKLSYEGIFNADELFSVISTFFFERGWDWYEKMNQAQVTPSGKQVRIILEPWKSITDYYKIAVCIRLIMNDVKNVEVEHEGKPLQLNQGAVKLTLDGYVISDRKNKWKDKPLHWFLSIILEKYTFKEHYRKAESWIKSDVEDLHQQIKSYLNAFKYSYGR
ncbi:MAG: hypothetical protein AB1668_06020 [Nanoarchaeota archaeon]